MAIIQEQSRLTEYPIEIGEKLFVQNLDVPTIAITSRVVEVTPLEIPKGDRLFHGDKWFQRVSLKTCEGVGFGFTTARRLAVGVFVSRGDQYRFFRIPRNPQDLLKFSIEEIIDIASVPHSSDLVKVKRLLRY